MCAFPSWASSEKNQKTAADQAVTRQQGGGDVAPKSWLPSAAGDHSDEIMTSVT